MYKNIHFICKSIELVTILKLNMLHKKILYSRKLTKILFCYLKDLFYMHYLDCKNLIVPFFTDKSCSGIVNNALWSNLKELLTSLSYKNLFINVFGISKKFKKKYFVNTYVYTKYVIGNVYSLSDETVSFYVAFLLFKEVLFSNSHYFFLFFNEYIDIYYQVVNYYLLRSLNDFFNIFFFNGFDLSLIDLLTIYNIYFFFISVILLDIIECNMYSEYGSRANSMSNSIQHAKENVLVFSTLCNRYRQAKITNSIIEIVSSLIH